MGEKKLERHMGASLKSGQDGKYFKSPPPNPEWTHMHAHNLCFFHDPLLKLLFPYDLLTKFLSFPRSFDKNHVSFAILWQKISSFSLSFDRNPVFCDPLIKIASFSQSFGRNHVYFTIFWRKMHLFLQYFDRFFPSSGIF